MFDRQLFQLQNIKKECGKLIVFAIFQAILMIGQAYFLSKGLTRIWQGAAFTSQLPRVAAFFSFFMLRQLVTLLRRKNLENYANSQAEKLRRELLAKLWYLGPAFVQQEGTGNTVTLAIEGIQQIENYLMLILPKMVNMLIIPWILAAYIFFWDARSAVILIVVFPLIVLFMILLGQAAKSKADRQYTGFQKLSNHFIDALRGLQTLKHLGLGKRYASNIFQVSEEYRKATMSTMKVAVLSTFALDFFTTLSVAIISVFLGLALMTGELQLLPALIVLILSPDFFLSLREFAGDYHATLNGKNTLKQLYTCLNKSEFSETEELTHIERWGIDDQFTANQICLKYTETDNLMAVNNFSLSWQGYGKIGIVGLSGSGKSTLIKLLGGFLEPTKGDFSINGEHTGHLKQTAWQDQLLYIPQKPYLFHATLAENIAFYMPQASEKEILQAAAKAGLTELLTELPAGLATVIGEGGHELSGGQAQRVALARAFIDEHRRILLFDEPTAHLDIETEAEIKATMLPLLSERLVFFATHRLHWMREMDQIIVLDQGVVQAVGTHQALLASSAVYCQLVQKLSGGIANEKK